MNIKNLKSGLVRSTILAGLAAVSAPAVIAQDVDTVAEAEEDKSVQQTIVVTGSRIPRAGFDTVTPATVLGSEFIEDRGFTNVADALNEIPSFGTPGNSPQGDQSSQSVGQNFANFYGMGSQRTLTLVNGRRYVSSNSPFGSGAAAGLQVDLNSIPASLIERVETISVGGAPVYGSDAIAGTVNIILKDDFEGLEFSGSTGISDEGDMEEHRFSILAGGNFNNDRGNVVFSVDWNKRDGLIESERPHLDRGWQFREPCRGDTPAGSNFTAADCDFSRVLVENAHANLVSNGGVISTAFGTIPNIGLGAASDGNFYQFGPDGSVVPYDVGLPTGNTVWSIGGEGIFLPDVTNLYSPTERVLVNSNFNYDLASYVTAFGEFSYANTKGTELANQPFYQSGLFGDPSGALTFDLTNPFLTDSAVQSLTDLGISNFFLQRSSVDLTPGNKIDNEGHTWRFVSGFKGDFEVLDRDVTWEVSYNVGKSEVTSIRPTVFTDRLFYALDAVRNADGEIVCRVVDDPSIRPENPGTAVGSASSAGIFNDCQPLNFFGQGVASQAALDYVGTNVTAKSEITQEVFSATFGTTLFDLPAGPLGIAGGVFHREERADFKPGAGLEGNLTRSGESSPISGGYDVDEYYGEFNAPIVSPDMNIPFVFDASIEGAYRHIDNSLAGADETYTIGAKFAPVEDIAFKGNFTKSVRAPSVAELFRPQVQAFSFAADPCDGRNIGAGPAPDVRRANCVADGIDPDTFSSNVINASVRGVNGGNPNLQNETAESFAIGAVITPRWVEDLTVAIDYVEIKLEDSIETFSLTNIMAACYDSATFPNTFCGQFRRDPTTRQVLTTDAFESGFVNAGLRTFRGVTIDAAYDKDLSDWLPIENAGDLTLRGYVFLPQENVVTPIDTPNDNNGEPGNSEFQANYSATWSRDSLSVFTQARYIGEAVINNNDVRVATDTAKVSRDILDLDSQWIVNAGVNYSINDVASIRVNVNNLFNELPSAPAIASGNDGVYDNMGRYYRVGFNLKF